MSGFLYLAVSWGYWVSWWCFLSSIVRVTQHLSSFEEKLFPPFLIGYSFIFILVGYLRFKCFNYLFLKIFIRVQGYSWHYRLNTDFGLVVELAGFIKCWVDDDKNKELAGVNSRSGWFYRVSDLHKGERDGGWGWLTGGCRVGRREIECWTRGLLTSVRSGFQQWDRQRTALRDKNDGKQRELEDTVRLGSLG